MELLLNHLWQSTAFALCIAVLCRILGKAPARVRYSLWLTASIKFLVPFVALEQLGTLWQAIPVSTPVTATAVEQLSTTFAPVSIPATRQQASVPVERWIGIWAIGFALIAFCWLRAWLQLRKQLRQSRPTGIVSAVPVLESQSNIEPGVFGIFRPVLMLPQGLINKLSQEEIEAVLAHELSHVRRKDNLTSACHMFISALFWFHPLLWYIGNRLIEERERACDESVLEQGKCPETYAQGILRVCRHYVESPLACAAGVGGSDLQQRIEQILAGGTALHLSKLGNSALLAAGVFSLSLPILLGVLKAQTLPAAPQHRFEVASIRKGDPNGQNVRIGPGPQGGLRTENTTTLGLLTFAFDLRDYQFVGGPGWIRTDRYNIVGTPDSPEENVGPNTGREKMEAMFGRQRQRVQALLMDRFGLILKAEMREMPIYGLTIDKSGHKLKAILDQNAPPHMRTNNGLISGSNVPVKLLTNSLSSLLRRPVMDETNLPGGYDFTMNWTPEGGAPNEGQGSIFTALREQMGLKLESKRGLAPVYVIEKIERPTEN
jgi:bla regulator protein blaR1